jgi:hypothetical protein
MSRFFAPITKEGLKAKIIAAFDEIKKDEDDDPLWEKSMNGDKEVGRIASIQYEWRRLTPQVQKDMKVEFDCENTDCGKSFVWKNHDYTDELDHEPMNALMGLNTLDNGLTFLGAWGGGDWESPVFFVIYWDGKKIRAYIPTDGNPWNTDEKCAYGNCDKKDQENIKKRFPSPGGYRGYAEPPEFNAALMLADIKGRILPQRKTRKSAKSS